MNEYKVYTKDNCPYCERVEKLLNLYKLNYTLHNLSDPEVRVEFNTYFPGATCVPQIVHNDTPIGDSIKFVSHLKELY